MSKLESSIIYHNGFIFNEVTFFSDLLDKENISSDKKQEVIQSLNLENINYKFVYEKDSSGVWYKHCYKGDKRISWNDINNWMRSYIWEFEKENNIFHF